MQDPKSDTHIETVHVTITGAVQGVGYRHATVRRAHLLGAKGWVQNLPDGTVEAMVQGTADQVDHMLEWLRQGPPGASVEEITTRREYTDKRYIRFEQL
ncbi:acylphosphatase [Achromobacter anxifer]|jgi:acylphosphatase|uniref:acylphosphatase n=1 Tax=Achromobacter anxifer TaxID=1287737 RepID=A0A6S7DHD5_9BURK|nr:acylphosphatase [Achromobacter anxifer]MDF8365296.1 acylphosphatase [Achromobacter anxifer]CAB3825170.1 Acylphosphatase [Achromobacter anxifer]CAB5515087.1 Acylphosphatase [Achromobacter anxifer]